jgi:GNAT superfamily N-acetyltransferase
MVVAAVEGEIAGFGGIDTNAVEQLKWLYVMPEFQGSGVGTQILKQLEEIGWSCGLSAIRLHAAPGASQFYQRHGYRVVEGDDVPHDHAGIMMIRELPKK